MKKKKRNDHKRVESYYSGVRLTVCCCAYHQVGLFYFDNFSSGLHPPAKRSSEDVWEEEFITNQVFKLYLRQIFVPVLLPISLHSNV